MLGRIEQNRRAGAARREAMPTEAPAKDGAEISLKVIVISGSKRNRNEVRCSPASDLITLASDAETGAAQSIPTIAEPRR